ncbi:hypothetical protein HYPSUDRAFT_205206 [Hypholoma sublateritium FD-334 SS-4]|uniref:Uncharacterized protein n=1 Tax=Hypholoma sublateritium (strain FD-334 SS-4) TaxID=945553 RepID=A0A0D2KVQ1_HYPSF|nr:hypothetical protein HYPSUDRAFT_205206 [Hypholoma sublateritium FD-334 SS-4]
MLILLFVFALFRHLQGAPLTPDEGGLDDTFPASHIQPRVEVVFGSRTTSDIVTSCLATIFACTWTAIHPNIPSQADSRWNIFKRRLVTTIYALLTPEFITLWAFRQYFGAKKIVEEYNSEIATRKQTKRQHGPGRPSFRKIWIGVKEWLFHAPPFYLAREGEIEPWTTTHGFFVQMGGFVLHKNGTPIQAVSFSKSWIETDPDMREYIFRHEDLPSPSDGIKELILTGAIDSPKTTKAEIEDRSKGDIISKTVVILQTTWFIAQCIARWSVRIPVTELEIVTLGYAMLNGITYALWWNKPQNVGVPVYLEIKAPLMDSLDDKPAALSSSEMESGIEQPQMNMETASNVGQVTVPQESAHLVPFTHSLDDKPAAPSSSETESGIELPQMHMEMVSSSLVTKELDYFVSKNLTDARPHKLSHLVRKLKDEWDSSPGYQLLLLIPYRLIQGVLRPISKLGESKSDYVGKGDLRVPIFFAEPAGDSKTAVFLSVVATLFGCAHLVPSFFLHYLSPTEMWLWRISAAFITVQPFFAGLYLYYVDSKTGLNLPDWVENICTGLILGASPLYVVARLALIILAFVSLRDLTGNALSGIDWISSIPHL